jgi:tetratricopeptide (TPR) repeat protein
VKTQSSARIQYLCLISTSLLAFIPSLTNNFALDDFIHIVHNPAIRHPKELFAALLQPLFPGNLYRPVTLLSNGLLYLSVGANPLPYHAMNILLHIIVTALAFAVLQRLVPRTVAFLSVLVWCVLPIHTEVVANVTGRAELLSAAFGLTAVLFSQIAGKTDSKLPWLTVIPCAVLYALSMGSKENGALWGMLILYCGRRHLVPYSVALMCAAICFGSLRFYALNAELLSTATTDPLDNPLLLLGQPHRLFAALALLGRYITITFIPYGLGSDYSYGSLLPCDSQVWLSGYCGAVALLFLLAFRFTAMRFGVLWFLITFAFTSNIFFPIGTIFGERLLYAPSIGLLLAAVSLMTQCGLERITPFAMLAYATVTWWSIPVWRDNTTLFTHQMEVSPNSAKAQLNFGILLRNKGDFDGGQTLIRAALERYPRYADAAFGLASIYAQKGLTSGSEHWLHEALKINPSHAPSLQLLGRIYGNRGDPENAVKLFEKAVAVDPNNIEALTGLLALAIEAKDKRRYDEIYARLLRLAPDNREFVDLTVRLKDL